MIRKLLACFYALVLTVAALPSAAALKGDHLFYADALTTLQLIDIAEPELEAPVTRAQAAQWLVHLAGAENDAAQLSSTPFWDVSNSPEISYAAHQGWVSGVTATEFRPNEPVTANAWFTMLLRMLGYSDKNGDFTVHTAPITAQRLGLVSQSYSGVMTQGDVFASMYAALTFPCLDDSGTVVQRLISRDICSRASANALGLLNQTLTVRQVADRYMAAVFRMKLYDSEKAVRKDKPSGNASGFFISTDGLAVTNYHSIEGAVYATATLSTGEVHEVEEVVYYDTKIDIAVIRLSRTPLDSQTSSTFTTLELVGVAETRAGDTVYTIGNPLGQGLAVSSGVISDPTRQMKDYALPCVMNTADISQGSSGGALLNVYGQVIAVTTGAYAYGNNMYLGVPVDPVMSADLAVKGMTLEEVTEKEGAAEAEKQPQAAS